MLPRTLRALLLPLALVLCACQVDVRVEAVVHDDGSGEVTVSVALDAAARAALGDPERAVVLDDVRTAGWDVTIDDDPVGETSIRASKPFADPEALAAVLDEVSGADGPFGDLALSRSDSWRGTTWRLDGTIDLTEGPAAFGDADLEALLGGDPLGGSIEAIERREGRPVEDMVSFTLVVDLPGNGSPDEVEASLADTSPTTVAVSSTTGGPSSSVAAAAVAALVAVAIGIVLTTRARRRRRRRRAEELSEEGLLAVQMTVQSPPTTHDEG